MPTTLRTVVLKYLHAGRPARGTRDEYRTTLKKWKRWGDGVPIEKLERKEIRDFLESCYPDAKSLADSAVATRLNAFLGSGMERDWERFLKELPEYGLPEALESGVRTMVPSASA